MTKPETDWKRPPVTEVVLGVQFDAISRLTNGHLGWFWGELHSEFPHADDVPPIAPVVEVFGDRVPYGFPMFNIRASAGDSRLRMTSTDGSRMIQVQNGWLIANWIKTGGVDYPGFDSVKSHLDSAMTRFRSFLAERDLGVIKPNLWEVTYTDQIPVGTVWDRPTDLSRVFPGLFGACDCANGAAETVDATFAFRLSPLPGRLRMTIQSARLATEPTRDLLVVQSVARGPLKTDNSDSLDQALNFGRSSVVDTFMRLASDDAKRYWRGG